VTGPLGDYYLSQTAAGQAQTSPCVDYGFTLAESLALHTFTTRTDTIYDSDTVDLGYHYPTQPWIGKEEFLIPDLPVYQSMCVRVFPTCTNSRFTVTVAGISGHPLRIMIYDNAGRRRSEIFNGMQSQQAQSYSVDVRDQSTFPNGVYFVVVECPMHGHLVQKIVITR
jgi:hypothetical protein